jgi:hypothetical protein
MIKQTIGLFRYWLGIALFLGIVGYSIYRAPEELWSLKPDWLLVVIPGLVVLLYLQSQQVSRFIKLHHMQVNIDWILLFTARKGVLNSILPARLGTLAVMKSFLDKYQVGWQAYIKYNIYLGVVSIIVSALMLMLLIATGYILLIVLFFFVSAILLKKFGPRSYRSSLVFFFINAILIYIDILIIFWGVMNGLGIPASIMDASYFAIALNALSQVSITPGNMGVREVVLGIVSPYLSFPTAAGVLSGGIFFVLRLVVNVAVLLLIELKIGRSGDTVSLLKDK